MTKSEQKDDYRKDYDISVDTLFYSCEFTDHFCCCKLARKFPTVVEAFEYMNSLFDEEFDDPKMTIIPPKPDAVSDEETIEGSFTNCNIDETCGDLEIRDTAETLEVLLNI
ncbi:hypothetical protein HNY73_012072 [Argiope bruennichi]|uniref:Uncharacterized protein n=1 Tax=Argiope bruennichi TaxID=94029 RepID=A0A8T0EZE1_ARGBR|nr:hypothetical protein HNY73_012072 [Argiope bruennichi]